jgi:hypothetical protein
VLIVLAVATGLAAGDLVPQAIGALGTVLVWLILSPVTAWSGVAAVAVYHGSVWVLAFTGGSRWAVFGVSLFMAVAQALNLGVWHLTPGPKRATGYARVGSATASATASAEQHKLQTVPASGWT